MSHEDLTREELIRKIESLELLNNQLLTEREQEAALDFAWSGNLGHWYWNVADNQVTFNPLKVTTLGYGLNEVPRQVPFQFFTGLLHPDDYETAMSAMREHLQGRSVVYEVEYRIRAKDGSYLWYYDRGKVTAFDENGRPLFVAGIVFDITEKKKAQQELERQNEFLSEQMMLDSMTGVANHGAILEMLRRDLSLAQKSQGDLCIVLFDIDDFKLVNDTRGHLFGDRVLTGFAELVRTIIRSGDSFGRYGGEEFLLILPQTNKAGALRIAERIRTAVEEHRFFGDIRITVSGGLKQYGGGDAEELIEQADRNLYLAKAAGKNRIM